MTIKTDNKKDFQNLRLLRSDNSHWMKPNYFKWIRMFLLRSTANFKDPALPILWECTLTVWEREMWQLWGRREMQGLGGEIWDKEKMNTQA